MFGVALAQVKLEKSLQVFAKATPGMRNTRGKDNAKYFRIRWIIGPKLLMPRRRSTITRSNWAANVPRRVSGIGVASPLNEVTIESVCQYGLDKICHVESEFYSTLANGKAFSLFKFEADNL